MRDGKRVLLWDDCWLENSPLCLSAMVHVEEALHGVKVEQMWERGVGWRWALLDTYLSSSLCKLAEKVLRPDGDEEDRFAWNNGSGCGLTVNQPIGSPRGGRKVTFGKVGGGSGG